MKKLTLVVGILSFITVVNTVMILFMFLAQTTVNEDMERRMQSMGEATDKNFAQVNEIVRNSILAVREIQLTGAYQDFFTEVSTQSASLKGL